MSKFKKVAAGPTLKANLPKFNSFGSFMDFIKSNPEQDVQKFFTGENSKRNLNYLASMMMGWTTDRYKPSAFKHALEMDEYRGINKTKASQGAYELMSPELISQLEDFKKNPPSNLTDFVTKEPVKSLENINVPEASDRYKAMEEKLYGKNASNQKFIKTSQNDKVEELKKIMPEWTIENVLNDMANVAKNPRLSNAEKQKNMFDVLNNYERSISPLSQYLEKNGIKPK
jgi:hypothetical protein